jgi:hypothetical protein
MLSSGPYLVAVDKLAVDWVGVAWDVVHEARESEESAVARKLEA